ncbi:MAG TPA: hypothetical protein PKM65_12210 [Spirochaetota bacterium]|nr:hypothetical protein [Spirochaetota bacterium]HNT09563.1 hypothetical protein [Spirochaetota bacterium]HNV45607.1 hypothetical protein [Spirochaetota bacterium]HOS40144.1 hypothetical protein [Spirochaetota bacterium]HPU87638.1 hypothetical protein [Spirochaetota bacterium]
MKIEFSEQEAAFIFFMMENMTKFEGLDKQTQSAVHALVARIQATLRAHGIDERSRF